MANGNNTAHAGNGTRNTFADDPSGAKRAEAARKRREREEADRRAKEEEFRTTSTEPDVSQQEYVDTTAGRRDEGESEATRRDREEREEESRRIQTEKENESNRLKEEAYAWVTKGGILNDPLLKDDDRDNARIIAESDGVAAAEEWVNRTITNRRHQEEQRKTVAQVQKEGPESVDEDADAISNEEKERRRREEQERLNEEYGGYTEQLQASLTNGWISQDQYNEFIAEWERSPDAGREKFNALVASGKVNQDKALATATTTAHSKIDSWKGTAADKEEWLRKYNEEGAGSAANFLSGLEGSWNTLQSDREGEWLGQKHALDGMNWGLQREGGRAELRMRPVTGPDKAAAKAAWMEGGKPGLDAWVASFVQERDKFKEERGRYEKSYSDPSYEEGESVHNEGDYATNPDGSQIKDANGYPLAVYRTGDGTKGYYYHPDNPTLQVPVGEGAATIQANKDREAEEAAQRARDEQWGGFESQMRNLGFTDDEINNARDLFGTVGGEAVQGIITKGPAPKPVEEDPFTVFETEMRAQNFTEAQIQTARDLMAHGPDAVRNYIEQGPEISKTSDQVETNTAAFNKFEQQMRTLGFSEGEIAEARDLFKGYGADAVRDLIKKGSRTSQEEVTTEGFDALQRDMQSQYFTEEEIQTARDLFETHGEQVARDFIAKGPKSSKEEEDFLATTDTWDETREYNLITTLGLTPEEVSEMRSVWENAGPHAESALSDWIKNKKLTKADTDESFDPEWSSREYSLRTNYETMDLTDDQIDDIRELWDTQGPHREASIAKYLEDRHKTPADKVADDEDDELSWEDRKYALQTANPNLTEDDLLELEKIWKNSGSMHRDAAINSYLDDFNSSDAKVEEKNTNAWDEWETTLKKAGWSDAEIDKAFGVFTSGGIAGLKDHIVTVHEGKSIDEAYDEGGMEAVLDVVDDFLFTKKAIERFSEEGEQVFIDFAEELRELYGDDFADEFLEQVALRDPFTETVDKLDETLRAIIGELGFDPSEEKEIRRAGIDADIQESYEVLARQGLLRPGAEGEYDRAAIELEKERLRQYRAVDSEINMLAIDIKQKNLTLLTDSLAQIGALSLTESQFDQDMLQRQKEWNEQFGLQEDQYFETIRQFDANLDQRVHEWAEKFGLDEAQTNAMIREIHSNILNKTRQISNEIGISFAEVTGIVGTESGELSLADLGLSVEPEQMAAWMTDPEYHRDAMLNSAVGRSARSSYEAMLGQTPTDDQIIDMMMGGKVAVESMPTLEARQMGTTVALQNMERINRYDAIASELGLDEMKFHRAVQESDRTWNRMTGNVAEEFGLDTNQFRLAMYRRDQMRREGVSEDVISDKFRQQFNEQYGDFLRASDAFDSGFGNAQRDIAMKHEMEWDRFERGKTQADLQEDKMEKVWSSFMDSRHKIEVDDENLQMGVPSVVSAFKSFFTDQAGEIDTEEAVKQIFDNPEFEAIRSTMDEAFGTMSDYQWRSFIAMMHDDYSDNWTWSDDAEMGFSEQVPFGYNYPEWNIDGIEKSGEHEDKFRHRVGNKQIIPALRGDPGFEGMQFVLRQPDLEEIHNDVVPIGGTIGTMAITQDMVGEVFDMQSLLDDGWAISNFGNKGKGSFIGNKQQKENLKMGREFWVDVKLTRGNVEKFITLTVPPNKQESWSADEKVTEFYTDALDTVNTSLRSNRDLRDMDENEWMLLDKRLGVNGGNNPTMKALTQGRSQTIIVYDEDEKHEIVADYGQNMKLGAAAFGKYNYATGEYEGNEELFERKGWNQAQANLLMDIGGAKLYEDLNNSGGYPVTYTEGGIEISMTFADLDYGLDEPFAEEAIRNLRAGIEAPPEERTGRRIVINPEDVFPDEFWDREGFTKQGWNLAGEADAFGTSMSFTHINNEWLGDMASDENGAMVLQALFSLLNGGNFSPERGGGDQGGGWASQLGQMAGQLLPSLAMAISDPTAKKDMVKVGASPSGINIYEFSYKPEIGISGRFRGVLSTEVPEQAVVRRAGAYDVVNYGKIDVAFRKIG